ncbi:MAG: sugar ABC transporter substrate-binding protein [Gammaproteobacteria bacterium]|nr:sugar ABC transporter substrate-binding protein [Gammaproteobacteria bacterium]
MKHIAVTLVALLMLGGCVTPGQQMPAPGSDSAAVDGIVQITASMLARQVQTDNSGVSANPQLDKELASYEYRVGAKDILTFTVWDHPELTIPAGEFRSPEIQGHLVAADGSIFFPYVGSIVVTGKTLGEIRELVSARLARYIQNPQLDVRVAAFRSKRINVTGEVETPGIFPITDVPMTLIEAIGLAGGAKPTAALQEVRVTHDGSVHAVNVLALLQDGDLTQNLVLDDGDLVHVPDNSLYSVHVLGSIDQAGVVAMPNGRLNLAEVITRSGGFDNSTADARRIFVFRQQDNKPAVYWLDARTPDSMLLATRFAMQPQDVVYIDATGLARWNRIVSLLLPSIQTLWQTQSLVDDLQN